MFDTTLCLLKVPRRLGLPPGELPREAGQGGFVGMPAQELRPYGSHSRDNAIMEMRMSGVLSRGHRTTGVPLAGGPRPPDMFFLLAYAMFSGSLSRVVPHRVP